MIDRYYLSNYGMPPMPRFLFEEFLNRIEGLSERMEEASVYLSSSVLGICREVGPVLQATFYGDSKTGSLFLWFYLDRSSDRPCLSTWRDTALAEAPSRTTVPGWAWEPTGGQRMFKPGEEEKLWKFARGVLQSFVEGAEAIKAEERRKAKEEAEEEAESRR